MKSLNYKINKLYLLSSLLSEYISENEEQDKEFILKEIEEIELTAKEISCEISDRPYN